MTHPNDEKRVEEFESQYSYLYQGTVYKNGGGNFNPVHENVKRWLRTTLAEVRKEERERIILDIQRRTLKELEDNK